MKKSELLHYDLVSVAGAWLDLNVREMDLMPSDAYGHDRRDYGELVDSCQETILTLVWEYVETLREENGHEKTNAIINMPGEQHS